MKKYNKMDLILLEKVYLRLLPFVKTHPNLSSILEGTICSRCGSNHLQSRGEERTLAGVYKRFQCQSCGGWGRFTQKERTLTTTRNI